MGGYLAPAQLDGFESRVRVRAEPANAHQPFVVHLPVAGVVPARPDEHQTRDEACRRRTLQTRVTSAFMSLHTQGSTMISALFKSSHS